MSNHLDEINSKIRNKRDKELKYKEKDKLVRDLFNELSDNSTTDIDPLMDQYLENQEETTITSDEENIDLSKCWQQIEEDCNILEEVSTQRKKILYNNPRCKNISMNMHLSEQQRKDQLYLLLMNKTDKFNIFIDKEILKIKKNKLFNEPYNSEINSVLDDLEDMDKIKYGFYDFAVYSIMQDINNYSEDELYKKLKDYLKNNKIIKNKYIREEMEDQLKNQYTTEFNISKKELLPDKLCKDDFEIFIIQKELSAIKDNYQYNKDVRIHEIMTNKFINKDDLILDYLRNNNNILNKYKYIDEKKDKEENEEIDNLLFSKFETTIKDNNSDLDTININELKDIMKEPKKIQKEVNPRGQRKLDWEFNIFYTTKSFNIEPIITVCKSISEKYSYDTIDINIIDSYLINIKLRLKKRNYESFIFNQFKHIVSKENITIIDTKKEKK